MRQEYFEFRTPSLSNYRELSSNSSADNVAIASVNNGGAGHALISQPCRDTLGNCAIPESSESILSICNRWIVQR